MLTIESAARTHVGNKRSNNEDSFLVDDALGLYIVADGMGGHLAGEVASRVTVDTMRDYISRFKSGSKVEELEDADSTLSTTANRLLASIKLANLTVIELAHQKKTYSGMGSTVSTIYMGREKIVAANIGDSPIYLVRDDNISLLSVPHTVAAEHAAIKTADEDPLSHRYNHILTRAVGKDTSVSPDFREIDAASGDILILCSDGLTNYITPEEILLTVQSDRPDAVCQKFVDIALERGGNDNITVVILKIEQTRGLLAAFIRFFRNFFTRQS